jgi:type IV secretory pathway TrbD component
MTNEIKRILTDQNIIKRADQTARLNLGLRHHIVGQRDPCPWIAACSTIALWLNIGPC